ncbi:hypothetical protein [Nostoc sp.]
MNSINTVEISKNPCIIEVMDNCILIRDLKIPLREAVEDYTYRATNYLTT